MSASGATKVVLSLGWRRARSFESTLFEAPRFGDLWIERAWLRLTYSLSIQYRRVMLPTFLGIGAPKAATTWLFRCLEEHPDVFVANVKETEFFSWGHTIRTLDEYQAHFAEVEDETAVGEVTTSYLYWEGAAKRMQEVLSEVRLFVSLRNPIDQVYSHYWHLRRQNFHQEKHPRPERFEEALEMYPEKLLRPARYAEHLERWLSLFDREQLHVIFFDDIQTAPEEVIEGLYAFLNVDSSVRPSTLGRTDKSVRRGTSPRNSLYERVYTQLYDGLTQYVYHPVKQWIGPARAEHLKNTLRVRETLETLLRREGYPEMANGTRACLREHFADDIARLERLTGRDLSHWT